MEDIQKFAGNKAFVPADLRRRRAAYLSRIPSACRTARQATREYTVHHGAVCILPLLENGDVLLERQFRYPMGEVMTEIPAGKLDYIGEDPHEAALRELREETGAVASELIPLGRFYPTCAYSTEVIHMFLARGLKLRRAGAGRG